MELKTLTLNGKQYDRFSKTMTEQQIAALDNMFKVCAFIKDDVSAEYNAFCSAFGIEGGIVPDEPDTPAVTLSSISATYSGGNVPVGTAVSALSGIVVTARYSDGSTKTVSGYTISGTIAEGNNTITVTYQGKTATFTVYGEAVAEKTLESISATYTGGSVPVGTLVESLTGINVTAHYSDGSTSLVGGASRSGTIKEGENIITITYQGKTTTVTVTGVAESSGEPIDTTAEFNATDVVLSTTNKTQPKTGYSATRPYDLGYSINGTAVEYVVYYLPGTDNLPSGQYNKIHVYLNGTYATYYTALGYNEEKKSLIEGRYGEANQLRFAFATDGVDDAYAYMETSGKVLFAGKNTPYYGMSNASQAQG